MKFKYLEYPRQPSLAFPDKDRTFRPALEVTVKHQARSLKLICIVDSGADMCAFPAKVGEFLGLEIKAGKSEKLKGIEGTSSRVYYHELALEVGGYQFECPIGFGEGIKFPVLGQDGFFDKFEVTFNYLKNEISLKPF